MNMIEVDALGKKYLIRHDAKTTVHHQTFREFLTDKAKSLFKKNTTVSKSTWEEFWALNNVNFSVKEGEILGVIGKNGAGKSTLLKLLSRITEPSTGNIRLYGRMASLLEVGTGFHPELTGRENIFLNGSILGMTRAEIKQKLDSIIEFAEVEKFLDTPVKRYSSGMYIRLAFAIAAHLDPEILLVDEVLAVGDTHFQKKCLGKMNDISKSGRTVIFVSHNMNTIRNLCPRSLYLENGKIVEIGESDQIIRRYLNERSLSDSCTVDLRNVARVSQRPGGGFTQISLLNGDKEPCHIFPMRQQMEICIDAEYETANTNFIHSIMINDSWGQPIYKIQDRDYLQLTPPQAKKLSFSIIIEDLKLHPGDYEISLWMGDMGAKPIDWIISCIAFEVVQGAHYTFFPINQQNGAAWVNCQWEFETKDKKETSL